MMIQPVSDRVLVKDIIEELRSPGGIILTEPDAEKQQQIGKIVAKGPGKMHDSGVFVEMDLEVGTKVMYRKYVGTIIEHQGNKYRMILADDILCYFV